jgi:hypothetical protein
MTSTTNQPEKENPEPTSTPSEQDLQKTSQIMLQTKCLNEIVQNISKFGQKGRVFVSLHIAMSLVKWNESRKTKYPPVDGLEHYEYTKSRDIEEILRHIKSEVDEFREALDEANDPNVVFSKEKLNPMELAVWEKFGFDCVVIDEHSKDYVNKCSKLFKSQMELTDIIVASLIGMWKLEDEIVSTLAALTDKAQKEREELGKGK